MMTAQVNAAEQFMQVGGAVVAAAALSLSHYTDDERASERTAILSAKTAVAPNEHTCDM